MKTVCSVRDHMKGTERLSILANHVSDRGLVCRAYNDHATSTAKKSKPKTKQAEVMQRCFTKEGGVQQRI